MPTDVQYDVVLCHSSKDQAVVRPLTERLRADGLTVWPVPPRHRSARGFGEWEIEPDGSVPAKIEAGLECSRVLACPDITLGRSGMLCMSAVAPGLNGVAVGLCTLWFRGRLRPGRRHVCLPSGGCNCVVGAAACSLRLAAPSGSRALP